MKNEDFLDKISEKFTDVIKKQLIEIFDNLSDDQKLILMQSVLENNISEIAEGENIEKFKDSHLKLYR